MDYKNKLKKRLYFGIGYIVIGIVIAVLKFCGAIKTVDGSAFGFGLVGVGIMLVVQYRKITKSEESLRRFRVEVNDERNISVITKAKSVTFDIYLMVICVAVIVLEIMDKYNIVKPLLLSFSALMTIYLVAYFVIRRKL